MTKKTKAYARAGVDVDLANRLKRNIHPLVRQTAEYWYRKKGQFGFFTQCLVKFLTCEIRSYEDRS
jgi:phosphoribosylaminoimidazole (AIR) synthetase